MSTTEIFFDEDGIFIREKSQDYVYNPQNYVCDRNATLISSFACTIVELWMNNDPQFRLFEFFFAMSIILMMMWFAHRMFSWITIYHPEPCKCKTRKRTAYPTDDNRDLRPEENQNPPEGKLNNSPESNQSPQQSETYTYEWPQPFNERCTLTIASNAPELLSAFPENQGYKLTITPIILEPLSVLPDEECYKVIRASAIAVPLHSDETCVVTFAPTVRQPPDVAERTTKQYVADDLTNVDEDVVKNVRQDEERKDGRNADPEERPRMNTNGKSGDGKPKESDKLQSLDSSSSVKEQFGSNDSKAGFCDDVRTIPDENVDHIKFEEERRQNTPTIKTSNANSSTQTAPAKVISEDQRSISVQKDSTNGSQSQNTVSQLPTCSFIPATASTPNNSSLSTDSTRSSIQSVSLPTSTNLESQHTTQTQAPTCPKCNLSFRNSMYETTPLMDTNQSTDNSLVPNFWMHSIETQLQRIQAELVALKLSQIQIDHKENKNYAAEAEALERKSDCSLDGTKGVKKIRYGIVDSDDELIASESDLAEDPVNCFEVTCTPALTVARNKKNEKMQARSLKFKVKQTTESNSELSHPNTENDKTNSANIKEFEPEIISNFFEAWEFETSEPECENETDTMVEKGVSSSPRKDKGTRHAGFGFQCEISKNSKNQHQERHDFHFETGSWS